MAEIALSPDGQIIAIAGGLGVWLIDSQTYARLRLLEGPTDLEKNGQAALVWSPDGTSIAAIGHNSLIWIWDVASGRVTHVMNAQVGDGQTSALRWSPDGRWLATAIGEWLLVWDFTNEIVRLAICGYREPHPPFPPDQGTLTGFDWSSDGSRLATQTWNGYIQLWDASSGEELQRARVGSLMRTQDLAWSPDGVNLAISYWTNSGQSVSDVNYYVRLLSAINLEVWRTFEVQEPGVRTLHWSPDGKLLAGAAWYAQVWEVQSGSLAFDVTDPDYALAGQQTLYWSHDGTRMVTRCLENGLLLCTWDVAAGTLLEKSPVLFSGEAHSVAWSPDGGVLAVGSQYGQPRILDSSNGALMRSTPGLEFEASLVSWPPDGTTLLLGDEGWVGAWDLDSDEFERSNFDVYSVPSWSPDGTHWVSGSSGRITFGARDGGGEPQKIEDLWTLSIHASAWSPDNAWIALGGQRYSNDAGFSTPGTLHLYNPSTQEDIALPAPDEVNISAVNSLAWSNDGIFLAAGYYNGKTATQEIQIWNIERPSGSSEILKASLATVLTGHAMRLTSLAWSAGGDMLASGDSAGVMILWSLQNQAESSAALEFSPTFLGGHTGEVRSLDWSPDDLRLASAGEDGTVRVWGVPQSAPAQASIGLPILTESTPVAFPANLLPVTVDNADGLSPLTVLGRGTVKDLSPSPDGRLLALASTGGVWLYDAETLQALYWLRLPNNGVADAVAWSPDGHQLAARGLSGWFGGDLLVVIWETRAWQLQRVLGPEPSNEYLLKYTPNLAWSPESHQLAAADDRQLYVWNAISGNRLHRLETAPAIPLACVAWLPGDDDYPLGRIVVGGGNRYGKGSLIVWDAIDGTLLQNQELPLKEDGYVFGMADNLALSPDGRLVLLVSERDGLQMWQVTLDGLSFITSFAPPQEEFHSSWDATWSPDSSRIIVAGTSAAQDGIMGTLWVLDAVNGQSLQRLHSHASDVFTVAWLPGGKRFASVEVDGSLRLWEALPSPDPDSVNIEQLRSAAAYSGQYGVLVWDVTTGNFRLSYNTRQYPLEELVWSPDGRLLAASDTNGQVRLNNVGDALASDHSGAQLWSTFNFPVNNHAMTLDWSPDGQRLAAGVSRIADYEYIAIFDRAGLLLKSVDTQVNQGGFNCLSWTPDGRLLAGAGYLAGVLGLWNTDSWEKVGGRYYTPHAVLESSGWPIMALHWSPEATRLVSIGEDGLVRIWGVLK